LGEPFVEKRQKLGRACLSFTDLYRALFYNYMVIFDALFLACSLGFRVDHGQETMLPEINLALVPASLEIIQNNILILFQLQSIENQHLGNSNTDHCEKGKWKLIRS
jgi:hypothetical protein